MTSQVSSAPKQRRIYGTDQLVVVDPEYDNFSSVGLRIVTKQDGRYTPETLAAAYGEDKLIFLRNRNLHDLPTSLRGTLIYVNNQVGVVLKAKGVYLLIILFYPGERSWFFEIVDCSSQGNSSGFYLQQIQNETLGSMNLNVRVARRPYPYLDSQGYISMDPAGPHVHQTIGIGHIDPDKLREFRALPNTLTQENFKVSSAVRRMRQSPFRNVLYVVSSDLERLGFRCKKNMFWVPVGSPKESSVVPAEAYGQTGGDVELFHVRDFVCLTRAQAKELKKMKTWMSPREWFQTLNSLANPNPVAEGNYGVFHFMIPRIHYCLVIKVITPAEARLIMARKEVGKPVKGNQILWQTPIQHCGVDVIYTRETKSSLRQYGNTIATWVKGDPASTQLRVTYQYVMELIQTFGCGFGSRQISACLDAVNIYRDARYNPRAHPSAFVSPEDIAMHQYYRIRRSYQKCFIQPILEKILHQLARQISTVGERENEWMMGKVSELATKLMATTGRTFYGFWNGCHLDSCDNVTKAMKQQFFADAVEEWQHRALAMAGFSFPTTFGIQHVWNCPIQKNRYLPSQQFLMEGLGLGFDLDDSVIQHLLAGAFTHGSALPILVDKINDMWTCNDPSILFKVFAFGNSNNKRTAAANALRAERLFEYRERQKIGRQARIYGEVPAVLMAADDEVDRFSDDTSTNSDSDWEDMVLDDDEEGAERDDDDSMYAEAQPVERDSDVDSGGITSRPLSPVGGNDSGGSAESSGPEEYDPSTTVENARGPSTDSVTRESRLAARAFPSPFVSAAAGPSTVGSYRDSRRTQRAFPSPFAAAAAAPAVGEQQNAFVPEAAGSVRDVQDMDEDVEPVPDMIMTPSQREVWRNRKRDSE